MYKIETTSEFERNIKLIKKRDWDISLLKSIILLLEQGQQLPIHCKNHKLSGNMKGIWDCHIQPDWLLLYQKDEANKRIILVATGTHSDLF
jgi:mRNA interferase YafQ